ncbi:hypothetical protein NDA18_003516 [Ustilago nuda]|nr:hypothetical protein NDA18_003516 [Ustilago nuda]
MLPTDFDRICEIDLVHAYYSEICTKIITTTNLTEFFYNSCNLPDSSIPALPSYELRPSFALRTQAYDTILLLPASKTEPFRLSTPLVVPKVGGLECPYLALRLICPATRHHTDPLFGLYDGQRPLTQSFFLQHLHLALSCLGLDTVQYAGHSFRRGAAMWAASQGVDADTIKLLGWWTSDCYRRYVDRSATDQRTLVASALYATHQGPLVPAVWWCDLVL